MNHSTQCAVGLARLCINLHSFAILGIPLIIPKFQGLKPENAEKNLENAFSVAEEELGIPRLLDVEDFILDELDEKSIMTYLSAFNRMYSKVSSSFYRHL